MGPLREMAGTPAVFHLTQLQFLLVFTARNYGDLSFWHWNSGGPGVGLGFLSPQGGPLQLRYLPDYLFILTQ